jgi:Fic family protein
MRSVELLTVEAFSPKGATTEILEDVDRAISEINRHRPLPEHLAHQLTADLLYDRIYSSAVTEGNRLSRRETIALLTTGIVEAGSRKDVAEVRNLGAAALRLDEFVRDGVELGEGAVRELHHAVLEGLDSLEPGCYRRNQVAIAGSATTPPGPGDIPDLVRSMTETLSRGIGEAHPVVLAAWAHWATTWIHPFRDGNGRVARLVQDYVLLRRQYLPVPLFAEDRERQYYDALEAADEGETRALVELLSKNILRVADRYLSAVREDSEKQAWLTSITRAATERARDTEHRRFMQWDRRLSSLRLEFQELAERVTNDVPGLTIRIPTYQGVDLEKHKALRSRGHAPMTWIFGVDFKHEEARLRFVFWAARHHLRPRDTQAQMTDDPVILVSMEEEPDVQRERPFYQALDHLSEGMITLREIIVDEHAFTRRRLNPVSREDEWDVAISAGQIARDFYTEVLQKLFLV